MIRGRSDEWKPRSIDTREQHVCKGTQRASWESERNEDRQKGGEDLFICAQFSNANKSLKGRGGCKEKYCEPSAKKDIWI